MIRVNIDIYTAERIRHLNGLIGRETISPVELRRAISTAKDLAHRLKRFDPDLIEKRMAGVKRHRKDKKATGGDD